MSLIRLQVPGSPVDYWLPSTAACGSLAAYYQGLTADEKRAQIQTSKPAPPQGMVWVLDPSCALTAPNVGTIQATVFPQITRLGYNRVTDGFGVNICNIVFTATATIRARLLENGQVIPGAGWINPGNFRAITTAEQGFVPNPDPPIYNNRFQFNAAQAGTFGVIAGKTYQLDIEIIGQEGTYNRFVFTPGTTSSPISLLATGAANQAPVVSTAQADATATVGTPLTITLPVNEFSDPDGSIASVSVGNLPPGLTYNAANKQITGTPTTAGTYTVNVVATDNQGATVTDPFDIVIGATATTGGQNTIDDWAGAYAYGTMRLVYVNDSARMNLVLVDNGDDTYSINDTATGTVGGGNAIGYKLDYYGRDFSITSLAGKSFPKNQAMLIQKYEYRLSDDPSNRFQNAVWSELNQVIF